MPTNSGGAESSLARDVGSILQLLLHLVTAHFVDVVLAVEAQLLLGKPLLLFAPQRSAEIVGSVRILLIKFRSD